jgi:hydroxymethylglutaryl-CoA lyase
VSAEVALYEVGPRDGLQNEAERVPLEAKLALIARLADAGLRSIEVTSFVSPRWIPQLADADELAARFERRPGVCYAALVPNAAGWERFQASGRGRAPAKLDVAAFFISASETHNRRNVNRGIREHLEAFRPVAEQIRAAGVPLRCYLSTACGCPYEGEVRVAAVVALARELAALGVDELSIGDTLGVGTPPQVRELVAALAGEIPLERLALHLHDTYGRALANVQAGFEAGVRRFDASLGGLGGCPYAPGAAGNVASEDVVDLFERQGVATGVDLAALVETSAWLEREVLRRSLPGRVYRARRGGTPAPAATAGAPA